jgi:hypothetical protein
MKNIAFFTFKAKKVINFHVSYKNLFFEARLGSVRLAVVVRTTPCTACPWLAGSYLDQLGTTPTLAFHDSIGGAMCAAFLVVAMYANLTTHLWSKMYVREASSIQQSQLAGAFQESEFRIYRCCISLLDIGQVSVPLCRYPASPHLT